MASVKMNSDVPRLKAFSIKCGWIDTPEHPGYPPTRKPSGATIAEVARFNARSENPNKRRDFAELFATKLATNPSFKRALGIDIAQTIEKRTMTATRTRELMLVTLISAITEGDWQANSAAWTKFKSDNNLSLSPLIASQIMLDTITTEVSAL